MSEAPSHGHDAAGHDAGHGHQGTTMTTKRIWTVFWILLGITLVEVVWGMKVSHTIPHQYEWLNPVFFLSMTFVKAGYIVAEFMHLRYEVTAMIRSVLIPLLLFIWFVLAFCFDGASWLHLRQAYSYNPNDKQATQTEQPAPAEGTLK